MERERERERERESLEGFPFFEIWWYGGKKIMFELSRMRCKHLLKH